MSRAVLVAIACVGVASALGSAVRGRGTRRPPPLGIDPGSSFLHRLSTVVARASALFAAGAVTGVLVLGLGLRLMMRVAAVTSPGSQGREQASERKTSSLTRPLFFSASSASTDRVFYSIQIRT